MNREIKMISTNELEVDQRYQRPVDTKLVAKIATHYSEPLFAPLLVAQRKTAKGTVNYVVDGQHRLEAARLLHLPEVPCFLYVGMSPADEATLFVNQQVASCRLTPRDTYKANVFIGNPENIDVIIDNILTKAGHRVAIHSHDIDGWWAIVALRETVKKVGSAGLSEILDILNTLKWVHGRASKSRLMLVGIAHAIKKGHSSQDIIEVLSLNYKKPEELIYQVQVTSHGRKQTIAVLDVIDSLFKN